MQNNTNPQHKKDALTLAIENNPCGTCRACGVPPPCKGHAGKDGKKEGGKNDPTPSGKKTPVNPASPAVDNTLKPNTPNSRDEKNLATEWGRLLKEGRSVQFEAGLLKIENVSLRGILTLRPKPGLSKEEAELVQNFLKMIKNEFDEFKEELQEKGISTTQFTANIKDNELNITIPNPKYFAEFMQKLTDKNLLPNPAIVHQDKQNQSQGNEKKKYPSPFDLYKGPKPKGWKDGG